MTRLITTFFYVGLLKPAPGTWGSLAAIPTAWIIHALTGFVGLAVATVVVAGIGWWATRIETTASGEEDPSEIVIDEVLGMFLALWPVSYGAMFAATGFWALWPGILTAFLAFRFFDILKPGPVGLADRRGDALGVMLDDAIAGGLAMMVVAVAAVFAHLIFV